jgi:O-antigen ligase
VILALLAFIAINFFSLLWTDDVEASLSYIRRYWYLLPIVVLFTSLQKAYIPKVLTAFLLGMFVSEIIAYGVFFELWHFKYATPQNPTPFMHHIEYSIFLALSALILLSRIFNEGDTKSKLIYTLFFITMSGNLFLTAGRTGQIAFILGLFVLAMLSFKNKVRAFITAMVVSSLLLTLAFGISETFSSRVQIAQENIENVIKQGNYCSSWGSRIGAYIAAKDIVATDPILGVGITDNMYLFRQLVHDKYPEMGCIVELAHMHNQYLQILTQLGIVGLFIFLSIFYMIGKIKLDKGEFYYIKYTYLIVLLFALIPEVLLHRAFSLTLFALMVGLLLAQERVEHEV